MFVFLFGLVIYHADEHQSKLVEADDRKWRYWRRTFQESRDQHHRPLIRQKNALFCRYRSAVSYFLLFLYPNYILFRNKKLKKKEDENLALSIATFNFHHFISDHFPVFSHLSIIIQTTDFEIKSQMISFEMSHCCRKLLEVH